MSDSHPELPLLDDWIAAAQGWIDGPYGWLGRCIGIQELELLSGSVPTCRLPFGPIIEIVAVTYLDTAGDEQTLPPETYRLVDGQLVLANGASWPATLSDPEAVRVRYRAGYAQLNGDQWEQATPGPVKQAILLLVGHWFTNREGVVTGTIATTMPLAVEALLSPYRSWSF